MEKDFATAHSVSLKVMGRRL